MKLSFDYQKLSRQITDFVLKYRVSLTSLVILALFSFAILRISALSNPPIDQNYVKQELSKLKSVTIDTETVEEIKQLTDSNIDVDPRFDRDRDNPFSE